ncbi:MAG: hypothetical protein P0Y53_24725 [Candidatus Pseudobacter hemicellulosilyticus]|uniref:Uncharacterized protein n=1 Tax=Candidatus Pseudobacter hemicellulosilyticus TaxID=3121375 RepID=A0AAJ6BHA8_9BACT|nr:MAG: hypothetical protein P0Y53_24725 [Pseudobacter sp.]
MSIGIKLNFEDRYEVEQVDNSPRNYQFFTELTSGEKVLLGVKISLQAHPLMSNVYNLAFGPVDKYNNINDQSKLQHKNYSKVFSTIIYIGTIFLMENQDKYLGIDGSNNARAYFYYRSLQNNLAYLEQFFKLQGVRYYVRLLRKENPEDPGHLIDATDMATRLYPILPTEAVRFDKLYNYIVFNLSTAKTNVYEAKKADHFA